MGLATDAPDPDDEDRQVSIIQFVESPFFGDSSRLSSSGKVDVGNFHVNINSKSFARRAGLTKGKFPKRGQLFAKGEFSWRDEIMLLAEEVSKLNSGPAAELLLQVAAVGVDRVYKYTAAMAPLLVQHRTP